MDKLNLKTAIIPHNNDILMIRKYQDNLKGIPCYPLYFFLNENIPAEEIRAITVTDIPVLSENTISLEAKVHTAAEEVEATLILMSNAPQQELPPLSGLNLKVFQAAVVNLKQNGTIRTWEILSSKWIDSRS